jgi:hypothetical protein
LNPAIESQAVGRVYRLGQTRPVQIIRLIMQGSVESRIRTMLQIKYGTTSSTSIVPIGSNNNKQKHAPGSHAEALIRCLKTEKNIMVEGEFDLLYGAAAPVVPDTMMSLMPPAAAAAGAALLGLKESAVGSRVSS